LGINKKEKHLISETESNGSSNSKKVKSKGKDKEDKSTIVNVKGDNYDKDSFISKIEPVEIKVEGEGQNNKVIFSSKYIEDDDMEYDDNDKNKKEEIINKGRKNVANPANPNKKRKANDYDTNNDDNANNDKNSKSSERHTNERPNRPQSDKKLYLSNDFSLDLMDYDDEIEALKNDDQKVNRNFFSLFLSLIKYNNT
jgi:hypothetical protein